MKLGKKNTELREVIVEDQKGPEAQGSGWEQAAADLAAACAEVKAKREELLAELKEKDKQRDNFNHIKMDVPQEGNPFDREAIRDATRETGSPVVEKEWVALSKALNASVFMDDTFLGALLASIDSVRMDAIRQDHELQKKVADAKKARDQAIQAAEAQVKDAVAALEQHRRRFADDFVKPVLDADNCCRDLIPLVFRDFEGFRNAGLQYGPNVSIEAQVSSLWGCVTANIKIRKGADTYSHLKHLPGEIIPAMRPNMAALITAGNNSCVYRKRGE